MKISCSSRLRNSTWAIVFAMGSMTLSAQTSRYFDQNSTAPDYGYDKDVLSHWSTSPADNFWNSRIDGAGTSADLSTWNNSAGDVAVFRMWQDVPAWGSRINVSVDSDLSVGGIEALDAHGWGGINFSSSAARSITLGEGAKVVVRFGDPGHGIIFGDNINIVGDFHVASTTQGTVQIAGAGNAYQGTITIDGPSSWVGGLLLDGRDTVGVDANLNRTRIGADAKIVLNSGGLQLIGTNVIGELSGSGGHILPTGGAALTIRQNTDTEWAGDIGGSGSAFINLYKEGSGRLSLTGTGRSYTDGVVMVREGSLYARGEIYTPSASPNAISVDDGAVLGGDFKTNKIVVLSAAGSIIDPGMFGEAGVMTLQSGLTAANGAVFRFNLNGIDSGDELLNSRIDITGGPVTLLGTKTVQFFDLGANLIESGVAYTLLSIDPAATLNAGWDENWSYDLGSTGWVVDSFGFSGSDLQVTFMAVPEPSSLALCGSILVGSLLLVRRQNRRVGR